MKRLFALAAVAALVSSPAFAKTSQAKRTAGEARASLQDTVRNAQAAVPYAVYVDGRFVGADPDPNVRLELQRDYYASHYGQ